VRNRSTVVVAVVALKEVEPHQREAGNASGHFSAMVRAPGATPERSINPTGEPMHSLRHS
jgi:hypothetical protein